MAQEAWRAYLELALGATEATRKKATKTVKRLAGKGAVSAEQLQSMVEDLLRTSSANRDALTNLVRYELERALGAVGLATADEVGALTARVRELETKLRAAAVAAPAPVAPAQVAPTTEIPIPAKVARKAVKKAVPGPIFDAGEPLAGTGDVELGAAEPAVPPAVKKTVARKQVAKSTVSNASATTAAVADAAAGPTKAAPAKAAKAAAAIATVAKATPINAGRTPAARRGPATKKAAS